MNCGDFEAVVETFYDGELDGRAMREAAHHIAGCPACESRLTEHERLTSLLSSSIGAELEGLDSGLVWAGLEEAIDRNSESRQRWPRLRLAAMTSRPRGVLLGRKTPRAASGEDSGGDAWVSPSPSPRRLSTAALGGGFAVAASLLFAILFWGEAEQPERLAGAPPKRAGAEPFSRSGGAGPQQVRIHSLNDFGGEMAMWAEPAGETAVIWLGDAKPQARR